MNWGVYFCVQAAKSRNNKQYLRQEYDFFFVCLRTSYFSVVAELNNQHFHWIVYFPNTAAKHLVTVWQVWQIKSEKQIIYSRWDWLQHYANSLIKSLGAVGGRGPKCCCLSQGSYLQTNTFTRKVMLYTGILRGLKRTEKLYEFHCTMKTRGFRGSDMNSVVSLERVCSRCNKLCLFWGKASWLENSLSG